VAGVNELLDPLLNASFKGFPHGSAPLRRSQVSGQGWNVLRGDLPLPLAVIRADRLGHNLGFMQGFAHDRGLELAPHGKTTLSPQLFQRQLQAGAWGMTVANVTQLHVARAAGAANCLIVNQVFSPLDLQAIANHLQSPSGRADGLRVFFLVDSTAQLDLIEHWQRTTANAPVFEVLLEVGVPGGRTGCRTLQEALTLACRLRASPAVCLAGIECYEGLSATGDSAKDTVLAGTLMQRFAEIAQACDAQDLFEQPEVLLSAGGSGIFDLVTDGLKPKLKRPVRGVLRSGCYLTHDQGSYRRLGQVMNTRLTAKGCANTLQAALEVWAAVQSQPEAGLAILTVGKRDISHDQEMPSVLRYSRAGSGLQTVAAPGWRIATLNDQHAYLRWDPSQDTSDTETAPLRVGDRICLGVSHPCTTFDKWRWMPLVDDATNVVDAITTCF
jgi:D-serine dehydratase